VPEQCIALIGGNGMLAKMVYRMAPDVYNVVPLDLPEFDLTSRDQVLATLDKLRPSVIINCAAYTNVDGCETEEDRATRVNGDGPGYLSEAALDIDAVLVHISTDYVFDGVNAAPYSEDDPVNPQSAYGRSKLAGEKAILDSGLRRYFILRTSWLYGPGGKNFVETIIRLACERDELRVVADQVGSPTYTEDLSRAIYRLLAGAQLGEVPFGIYHISDGGSCSWFEFAVEIVALAKDRGLPVVAKRVLPIATDEYPLPAVRPAYSIMSKQKYFRVTGENPPLWRDSLSRYFTIRVDGLT